MAQKRTKMGQRTCMIVQKHSKKTNSKNTMVFYHSWGIGRILPSQLISVLNGTLSARPYRDDFAESLKPQGTTDITSCFDKEELDKVDFDNPETVGLVIDGADNNNGGLFVKITTSETEDIESIEYAYMLGREEGGDYKRFCAAEDWLERAGGKYIDDDFRALYDATLKYFKAKEHATQLIIK